MRCCICGNECEYDFTNKGCVCSDACKEEYNWRRRLCVDGVEYRPRKLDETD